MTESATEAAPGTEPTDVPAEETEALAQYTVNGELVPWDMILEENRTLTERYTRLGDSEKSAAEILEDAIDNAIERVLLAQDARAKVDTVPRKEVEREYNKLLRQHGGGIAFQKKFGLTDKDEDRIRHDLRERIRVNTHLESLCAHVPRPTEEEVRDFYANNLAHYVEPETVRASHILLQPGRHRPPAAIMVHLLNVRQSILNGKPFAEAAAEHSDCDDEGGDLGFFPRGAMAEPFEKAAFALDIGEISEVVKTEFGFHLIQVTDKRPEEQQPFDKVRKDIESLLWDRAKNDAIGEYVDDLLRNAEIVRPDPPTEEEVPPEEEEEEAEIED